LSPPPNSEKAPTHHDKKQSSYIQRFSWLFKNLRAAVQKILKWTISSQGGYQILFYITHYLNIATSKLISSKKNPAGSSADYSLQLTYQHLKFTERKTDPPNLTPFRHSKGKNNQGSLASILNAGCLHVYTLILNGTGAARSV